MCVFLFADERNAKSVDVGRVDVVDVVGLDGRRRSARVDAIDDERRRRSAASHCDVVHAQSLAFDRRAIDCLGRHVDLAYYRHLHLATFNHRLLRSLVCFRFSSTKRVCCCFGAFHLAQFYLTHRDVKNNIFRDVYIINDNIAIITTEQRCAAQSLDGAADERARRGAAAQELAQHVAVATPHDALARNVAAFVAAATLALDYAFDFVDDDIDDDECCDQCVR